MNTSVACAAIWKRVLATLIDFVVLGVLGFLIGLIFGYNPVSAFQESFRQAMENPGVTPNPQLPPATANFANLVLGWLYNATLNSSPSQGTLGKLLLGIRVTDFDGKRIDFGRASVRYALPMVAALVSLVPALANLVFAALVDYLTAPFTPRKQTLHDMLASTVVLERRV